jgi:hypothetical protein
VGFFFKCLLSGFKMLVKRLTFFACLAVAQDICLAKQNQHELLDHTTGNAGADHAPDCTAKEEQLAREPFPAFFPGSVGYSILPACNLEGH